MAVATSSPCRHQKAACRCVFLTDARKLYVMPTWPALQAPFNRLSSWGEEGGKQHVTALLLVQTKTQNALRKIQHELESAEILYT